MGHHAALFTMAMVLLVAYIIPLPILPISSPYTSRFVWKMKPLYDAFFLPFKDGRTFLQTVLLSAVSSIAISYILQALIDPLLVAAIFLYMLFEPYKKPSHNDTFVFFLCNILTLVILSLCLKQYQVDPQQTGNFPEIRLTFTVLASIALGSGYLVIITLVIIWKLYPKAHSMYLILVLALRHRRHRKPVGRQRS